MSASLLTPYTGYQRLQGSMLLVDNISSWNCSMAPSGGKKVMQCAKQSSMTRKLTSQFIPIITSNSTMSSRIRANSCSYPAINTVQALQTRSSTMFSQTGVSHGSTVLKVTYLSLIVWASAYELKECESPGINESLSHNTVNKGGTFNHRMIWSLLSIHNINSPILTLWLLVSTPGRGLLL